MIILRKTVVLFSCLFIFLFNSVNAVEYSPGVDKDYPLKLLWGDTHLHTNLSADAYTVGNPLLHLWSLGVEAQFYLLVPFIYPLLQRNIKFLYFVIIVLFIICLGVLLISPKTSFYISPFRMWEFLIGAAAAFHSRSEKQNFAMQSALPIILVFAVLFLPIRPDNLSIFSGHPGITSFIICILTAQIIHFGIPTIFLDSYISKGMQMIGEYSYSIYLVHFPVIIFVNYELFNGNITGFSSAIDLIKILSLTWLLSYLSYNFLEKKRAFNFLISSKIISISIVLLLIIFGEELNKKKFSEDELRIFHALKSQENSRCGLSFRLTQPFAKICKLNSVSYSDNVLLVGNSHANAIKDTFTDIATKSDIAVYFYAQNDPLLSDRISSHNIINDALKFEIDVIVLHYQNLYKNEYFKNELNSLLKLAKENNIFIAIIAPVPVHYDSVPIMAYRLSKSGIAPTLPSFREYLFSLKDLNAIAEKNSSEFLEIYTTGKFFCAADDFCHAFSEEYMPYYHDKNHLTSLGANKLSPLFNDIVNSLKVR